MIAYPQYVHKGPALSHVICRRSSIHWGTINGFFSDREERPFDYKVNYISISHMRFHFHRMIFYVQFFQFLFFNDSDMLLLLLVKMVDLLVFPDLTRVPVPSRKFFFRSSLVPDLKILGTQISTRYTHHPQEVGAIALIWLK